MQKLIVALAAAAFVGVAAIGAAHAQSQAPSDYTIMCTNGRASSYADYYCVQPGEHSNPHAQCRRFVGQDFNAEGSFSSHQNYTSFRSGPYSGEGVSACIRRCIDWGNSSSRRTCRTPNGTVR